MSIHGKPAAHLKALEEARALSERLRRESPPDQARFPDAAHMASHPSSVRRSDVSGRGAREPSSLTAQGLTLMIQRMRSSRAAEKG